MKTKPSSPHPGRRGFTLIELLSTIAIVGILASLVVAMVGNAKKASSMAKCASQLRQIYNVVMLQAADNRGILVPGDSGGNPPPGNQPNVRWYQQKWSTNPVDSPLVEYAGGGDVWGRVTVCPLNLEAQKDAAADGLWLKSKFGYPYVVNYSLLTDATRSSNGTQVRTAQITSPSQTPMITDSYAGHDRWTGAGWEGSSVNSNLSRVAEIHSGKSNVLWADGHVTPLTRAELATQIAKINQNKP